MDRRTPVWAVTALLALSTAAITPRPAAADEPAIEEQLVDAFQALFGKHPGQRVNHAKGLVAEGTFAAAPDAASVSRAAHLQSGVTVPVTVRFSDATGLPDIPDGDMNANPHGLAIKFHLPDGTDTDIVSNSLHFFPVGTPEEFRDFLVAAKAKSPGRAEADEVRPVPGQPPRGRAGGRHGAHAQELRDRGVFRHRRLPAHQQGRGAALRPLPPGAGRRRDVPHRGRGGEAAAGLPERRDQGAPAAGPGDVPPARPGRGPRRPDHRRHLPLARGPRQGRARHADGDQARGRQRGGGQGAPLPARPGDRRDRALGRPADQRPGRRLRDLVLAPERSGQLSTAGRCCPARARPARGRAASACARARRRSRSVCG